MNRKLKMVYVLIMIVCIMLNYEIYGVEEIVAPLGEGFIENFTKFLYIMMGTFGVLLVLLVIIKLITSKKIYEEKLADNKAIKVIGATLCSIVSVYLIFEYIIMWKSYFSIPGIILAVFAIYQRVSNRNRKVAYTSLVMTILVYVLMRTIG